MDEQTKQALQELKATTDMFAANVDRWMGEYDAHAGDIAAIVHQIDREAELAWKAMSSAAMAECGWPVAENG